MRLRRLAPLSVLLIAAGCDDPSITEIWHSGTQLAVEACIKRNSSALVDGGVIKKSCIEKHQKSVNPQILDGKLSPDLNNPYGLSLSITMRNSSTDQIVTGALITVMVQSQGDPDLIFSGVITNLWIYPGGFAEAYAYQVGPRDEDSWTRARQLMKFGAKWSWYFSKATGIALR